MIYAILLIICTVVFAADPSLYLPFHSPKILLCIILSPLLLSMKYIYDFIKYRKSVIVFSIIEYLLLVQLVWYIIGNYRLITHPSDTSLYFYISLIFITFLTRQVYGYVKSESEHTEYENWGHENKLVCVFLRAVWIIGICQAIIGVGQYFSFPDFLPIGTIKTPMIGTIGTANSFGTFLAMAIVALVVDYLSVQSIKSKIYCWIAGGVLFIALLLNGSRGAILALIISIFIFIVVLKIRNRTSLVSSNVFQRTRFIAIVAFSFILCLGCIVYFLYNLNVESSRGRLFVWSVSAPMIAENPLCGVGAGRYSVEYLNYQSRFFSDENNSSLAYKAANMKQSHNEYFQAFCETGIIGGVLFLTIWIFGLWFLFTHRNNDNDKNKIPLYGLGAVLLVILLHSFVDTPLHIVPISVVAYCLLGFVPVPASFAHVINLKSKGAFFCILVLSISYSIFIVFLALNQYHGRVHWQQGYEYGKQHRWLPAVQEYQEALRYLPQEGELLFHEGAALVMQESYSNGIYYLQESIKWYNDRNIYLSLSYANLRMHNLKEAEQNARIALSMFPDHLAPHLLLGQILYEQGRLEESKKSLLKCIHRQTNIQSDDIRQICIEAKELWEKYYHENVPSFSSAQ